MIIGTGIDLLDVKRLESLMGKYGERFKVRYFTITEIQTAEARAKAGNEVMAFAKRFAAKEACAKALGTGFIDGIFMIDIEVTNDVLGKPSVTLHNGALERLKAMTPAGKSAIMHLSLTDELPYAQAQVIIEVI